MNAAETAAAGRAADVVVGDLTGRWGAVGLRSGILEEMATAGDVVDERGNLWRQRVDWEWDWERQRQRQRQRQRGQNLHYRR